MCLHRAGMSSATNVCCLNPLSDTVSSYENRQSHETGDGERLRAEGHLHRAGKSEGGLTSQPKALLALFNGGADRRGRRAGKKVARAVFTTRASDELLADGQRNPFGRGTGSLQTNRTDRRSKLSVPAPTPGSGWPRQGTSRITFGSLISRTDSTVTAPLPTKALASNVPFWTVPVLSICACTETV